ncbi:hypothetical protein QQF64_033417 [Cirrhinus molitorella]|uniref:Uncharacterized protein n=1 Tax=Cirrhinus molitorella TaxID=172907 RepID=A0ABR3MTU2_9TELE
MARAQAHLSDRLLARRQHMTPKTPEEPQHVNGTLSVRDPRHSPAPDESDVARGLSQEPCHTGKNGSDLQFLEDQLQSSKYGTVLSEPQLTHGTEKSPCRSRPPHGPCGQTVSHLFWANLHLIRLLSMEKGQCQVMR